MSEVVCMICEHGPHRVKPCAVCGCTQWVNSLVQLARGTTQVNNILIQFIPRFEELLGNIMELLAEINPEAVKAIDARREELRKQLEEQAASQQQGPTPDQTGQDSGSSGSYGSENTEAASEGAGIQGR